MIWQLYILENDHHSKSSDHLSPYKANAILLTIFSLLYIISPWLIYYWKSVLINLLHPFPPYSILHPLPPFSPLATTKFVSVSISLGFVFVCLFCFLNLNASEINCIFLYLTSKPRVTKAKINKWDYAKSGGEGGWRGNRDGEYM